MDNSPQMQLERMKGIDQLSCNKCGETVKEHVYIYKTAMIKKDTFSGFYFASETSYPRDTRPHFHIMFTILIHVFGIRGVLYKSFRFWLILVENNDHIDPQNVFFFFFIFKIPRHHHG